MRVAILTCLTCAVLVGAAPGRAQAAPPTVTVRPSPYGRVLFDGRGHVLYGFTYDRPARSRCAGACARAWPPYLVRARPRAGAGVVARHLGTTRRANGALQVTYFGRPLYYYVGDRRAGQILCQNAVEYGGVWRVVRASGRLVG